MTMNTPKQLTPPADMARLVELTKQISEVLRAPLQEQVAVKSPLGGYELQLRDVRVRSAR